MEKPPQQFPLRGFEKNSIEALIDGIFEPLKETHWIFKIVNELLKELLKKKD